MKVNKSHLINQTQYNSEVINKYKYIPSKWETIKFWQVVVAVTTYRYNGSRHIGRKSLWLWNLWGDGRHVRLKINLLSNDHGSGFYRAPHPGGSIGGPRGRGIQGGWRFGLVIFINLQINRVSKGKKKTPTFHKLVNKSIQKKQKYLSNNLRFSKVIRCLRIKISLVSILEIIHFTDFQWKYNVIIISKFK